MVAFNEQPKRDSISLTELLTTEEINEVMDMLKSGQDDRLRKYLEDRREALEAKGIVAEYLYYYLQFLKISLKWDKPKRRKKK